MPQLASIVQYIYDFTSKIASAAVSDAERWPEYGNADIANARDRYINKLLAKADWLNSQWNEGEDPSPLGSLYMVGASSMLGSWQPADAPQLFYNSESQSYFRHFDRISQLNDNRGFKIIDRRSWSGCFEMCSNGNPLVLNEDYVVSTTVGGSNITMNEEVVENVDVTLRQVGDNWVLRISDPSGVEPVKNDIAVTAAPGAITITVPQGCTASIYTLSGSSISAPEHIDGTCTVAVAPGFYIVKAGTRTAKVLVP